MGGQSLATALASGPWGGRVPSMGSQNKVVLGVIMSERRQRGMKQPNWKGENKPSL